MKVFEHSTPEGDEFQLRVVQALDHDPMFTPARYTISAERGGDGFEIDVELAPIYYHLLASPGRLKLTESAVRAAEAALDTGLREPAQVTVSSDGAVRLHARTVGHLL